MSSVPEKFDIDQKSISGILVEKLQNNKIRCLACGHKCIIPDGQRGICKVRFNDQGQLKVPYGYVSSVQCDPTEKKPFFHFLPGSKSFTFGMLGCDFHCAYCQNWDISQSVRDPDSTQDYVDVTPEFMAMKAKELGASLMVSSYNEPLITAEWAIQVFKTSKAVGLKTAFVSNGNATQDVLDFIRPYTDAYKVDLKSISQENYRSLGGKVSNVLDSIQKIYSMGFWLEIVTLLIPGFNDSDKEISELCQFIVSVSPDIPWHVTAFHKDYKMTDRDPTSPRALLRACEIGRDSGLNYIYAGNLPGYVEEFENTICPNCRKTVIKRYGFKILENRIGSNGDCPNCKTKVPGIWN